MLWLGCSYHVLSFINKTLLYSLVGGNMRLYIQGEIDLRRGVVLVEVRDEKGRICPRIGKRIWKAIKNELSMW